MNDWLFNSGFTSVREGTITGSLSTTSYNMSVSVVPMFGVVLSDYTDAGSGTVKTVAGIPVLSTADPISSLSLDSSNYPLFIFSGTFLTYAPKYTLTSTYQATSTTENTDASPTYTTCVDETLTSTTEVTTASPYPYGGLPLSHF